MDFSEEIMDEIKLKGKNKNDSDDIDISSAKDGGDVLELLLFGRKMDNFSIKEILFLLCRNSYDVDYKTFKKSFKGLSNIHFYDLFYNISKNHDLLNIMKILKIDKEYFNNLNKNNTFNCKFKRNGDLINSKYG